MSWPKCVHLHVAAGADEARQAVPNLPSPSAKLRFISFNSLRLYLMAYALQNRWVAHTSFRSGTVDGEQRTFVCTRNCVPWEQLNPTRERCGYLLRAFVEVGGEDVSILSASNLVHRHGARVK